VIIRQMMKKVEIVDVGDTPFIYGAVDRFKFHRREPEDAAGGRSALGGPVHLLGITRVSLNIDSWLSAASFRETARADQCLHLGER